MNSFKKLCLSITSIILFQQSEAANEITTSNNERNIISIAPIQITLANYQGIGIHYEHFSVPNGKSSFVLPVAFSKGGLYFNPGWKFYPAGSDKTISYSIGPSIPAYTSTFIGGEGYNSGALIGFMVNNGINVRLNHKLYLGSELGLGLMYFSGLPIPLPDAQLNFKIGYRF